MNTKVEVLFKVRFFDRRKNVTECILDIESIEKSIDRINKCKLIVFSIKGENRNALLGALSHIAAQRNRYSPIVEVGESELFFFPQLNYSDVYLLKSMFEEIFVEEEINIVLDANTFLK